MKFPEGTDPAKAILVKPQTVCCPGHGEHLRAKWPSGFAIVSVSILQAALESDGLMDACRKLGHELADVAELNKIFELRPMCYWVERRVIRNAFAESGIGSIGICAACGRSGLGGPYNISMPTGTVESWLCFECALDTGERMHRAYPKGRKWYA